MKKVALVILTFLGVFMYQGCNPPKKEITPDAGFGKYISAYTSGIISVESPIVIKLANPVEKEITPGIAVEGSLFDFEPSVKGKAVWADNSTIRFVPDSPMEGGTIYNGKFRLGGIVKTEKNFAVFPFSFSTIEQAFGVTSEGLKTYPGNDFSLMYFQGYVLTADVIAPETIEKVVSAKFKNRAKRITWTHDPGRQKHYFTADSLKRENTEPGSLIIEWNGKSIGINNKGEEEILVPALNDFKVLDASVEHGQQMCVVVVFSDPLGSAQNLDGLVTLEDNLGLKFSADGNRLKVWPGQQVSGQKRLTIHRGVANALGYPLKQDQEFSLVFENMQPEVRLIGKGVIVPQDGQLSMPFEAVSLNAVDLRIIQIYAGNVRQFLQDNNPDGDNELKKVGRLVYSGKVSLNPGNPEKLYKWNTYKVNIADYVTLEQGAFYRIELRFKKAYSLYESSGGKQEQEIAASDLEEKLAFSEEQKEWDSPGWYESYYYPPEYNWQERDNPCSESYFNSSRFVSRNIFASTLGIIAKEGKGNHLTFVVSNLKTTLPEQGVTLSVYDFQGRLIQKLSTGNNGMATVRLEKKPFLLVAEKDGQTGYLRLDDGSSLSMSNFDVSGQVVQEGLKGFIYGERGVWRPGDKLFLTFILEDKIKQLPANHPVIFKLINPLGQITERRVATSGENGFYHFAVATSESAPTGNWEVSVQVGGTYFSKRIKVETVKPNRLKIDLKMPEVIDIHSVKSFTLQSVWLHGAPARSLKTVVDLILTQKNTSFKGFEKYSFNDPASNFYPQQQEFFKGELSEQGIVSVPARFDGITSAPGMLKAWFTTRVFEQGGDFSTNVQSADVSPFRKYLGIKMPDSEDNWFKTDTEYQPEIAAVDLNGNLSSVKNVEVELYKIDWRWWWESGDDYLANYVNGEYRKPVKSWKIDGVQGKTRIKLNIKYQSRDDNGRYLLRVKDPESGQAAGITFYMSKWGSWHSEDSAEGATMLSIRTDKEKYRVGEKIRVTIPSSKSGRALASIESGEAVKDIFWVETSENATTFEVEAKPDMAPNVYIHVSLIQPYGQTENDAPLRLYGVAPVLVENPATVLKPVLSMKDEIEPEQEYEIKVSEQSGREMSYTLAVVDEGLLGLTNFKTPDPHQAFYAREALGVRTWDMYDYVAGAYGARLEKAFAVGGDESLNNEARKKVNRFKPVVEFAGPFTLKKGEKKVHRFKMPNYVGAVRAMVVAGNQGAYGNAEKEVKVRKGLMLLATLPRVLGPGESFTLPVDVFAMKEQVKNVAVTIEPSGIFEAGSTTGSLHFQELGEQMIYFKLKTKETTGAGKIKVFAKCGNETASAEIEIEVRNPNPPKTAEKNIVLEAGKSWSAGLTAPGMDGTNEMWLEISGIPPLNLSKHLDNLINYPHGCIEQTVSAAFPQLYLDKLTELTAGQKQEAEENIRYALQRLMAFQLADGGFSYWPGGNTTSDWGTSYAGHFMILAEQKGYNLPVGVKNKWLRFQQDKARNWNRQSGYRDGVFYNGFELEQAYRLYTLALAGSPDLGAMNRLRENLTVGSSKWRLAAAYLLAGQSSAANELVRGQQTEVENYCEFGGTYGSGLRDKAMILETLILQKDIKNSFAVLKEISDEVNRCDWLNTQTAAWCFYAASKFTDGLVPNQELNIQAEINGKKENFKTSVPYIRYPVKLQGKSAEVLVKNAGAQVVFARLAAKGIPLKGDSLAASNSLALDTWFSDKAGNPVDPKILYQGDDLVMNVKITHPGIRSTYENLALTAIFPSGWEIMNQRTNDIPAGGQNNFSYQDIRDDRVYTYFDLPQNGVRTYKFRLSAAYEGKFYLPAITCEAMYDNSVYASQPGKWVEVRKR